MRFVAVSEKEMNKNIRKRATRGYNQKFITDFETSDYSTVEIINFKHKNAQVCANSLRTAIKTLHKESVIKVSYSSTRNKVYLFKIPICNKVSL